MVTDATRKYREIFAYVLLGVAALYFISALSLLFKSKDDLGGADFTEKAALFGYLFSTPLMVISLAGAVALVTGWAENSKNAKIVVTAALGIGAVSLLLGIICWLAAFGSDQGAGGLTYFNGVFGAGKVVGIFLGIAQLGLLGLVTSYAFAVFQTFPKPERAQQAQSQWGQQGGWQQPGQQQGWGQQQGYDQAQQGWGQPGQQGQQQAWGQQQGYDHGQQQGWGQPGQPGQPGQQGTYGAGYGDQGQQWGAASTGAGGWGDQSAAQAEQQGQAASSWGQESSSDNAASGWGDPSGAPSDSPSQQSWGSPSEPAPPSGAPADETQVWGGTGEPPSEPGSTSDAGQAGQPDEDRKDDGEQPPQQGWWQQPSQ